MRKLSLGMDRKSDEVELVPTAVPESMLQKSPGWQANLVISHPTTNTFRSKYLSIGPVYRIIWFELY